MKSALGKSLMGIVYFVMFLSFHTNLYANTPATIKVGLESIARNTGSVKLESDANIKIGHYDENGFTTLGILDATQITVKLGNGNYYDMGVTFNNYVDAESYAQSTGGVPVYVDGNTYKVYTTQNDGSLDLAEGFKRSLAVYDSQGTLILISNEDIEDLVFRGYDDATGMPLMTVGGKKYRGAIGMGGTSGLTPYNVVDIEAYLYGVVPKEMPSSWPQEALKAQAVAARSIATYQYNRYVSSGYNVVDTTTTQVYGGYTAETTATNSAVDATRGQVIRYNGKPAEAVYFSTSGGVTEDAKNVWGSDISYLKAVPDIYETEPSAAPWTRTITLAEIDRCLANYGANIGKAQGVQIVSRTEAGRVQELAILGTNGNYTITSEKIRSFFSGSNGGSLRSRLFSFTDANIESNVPVTKDTQVAVVSASGQSNLTSKNLMVMSATDLVPITANFAVQSATGVTTLSTTEVNTQASTSTPNTSSETVWGDITVYGKGFGHGVGMSQSGAKGMAKAGFNYDEILKYYYTGITVE